MIAPSHSKFIDDSGINLHNFLFIISLTNLDDCDLSIILRSSTTTPNLNHPSRVNYQTFSINLHMMNVFIYCWHYNRRLSMLQHRLTQQLRHRMRTAILRNPNTIASGSAQLRLNDSKEIFGTLHLPDLLSIEHMSDSAANDANRRQKRVWLSLICRHWHWLLWMKSLFEQCGPAEEHHMGPS